MRKILLVVSLCCFSMFFLTGAQAAEVGAGVFGAAVDKDHSGKDYAPAGMQIDYMLGGTVKAGLNGFYFGDGIGLAGKASIDLGDFSLSAGVGTYGDHISDSVNVAGVDVAAQDSEPGDLMFIEASYNRFFVRVSQVETDFTLNASRQTGTDGMGNPIYSTGSKSISTTDRWLWVGVRFSI